MKAIFQLLIFLLCFCSTGYAQLIISSNTTWTTNQVLTQSVLVQQGATLTINPGVQVQVLFIDNNSDLIGDVKIEVKGSINVSGTACNKVSFIPYVATSNKQYWTGIEIDTLATGCSLNNAIIQNAYIGVKIENTSLNLSGLDIQNSKINGIKAFGTNTSISISNSIVRNSDLEGIDVANVSSFSCTNSKIKQNGSSGLSISAVSNVNISNSVVYNNSKSGLFLKSSSANLTNSVLRKNVRMGIILSNSSLICTTTDIDSNSVDGVFVGGSSTLNMTNSSLSDNIGFGVETSEYIFNSDFGNISLTGSAPSVNISGTNFINNHNTSVTLSSLQVQNLVPSVGYKIGDVFSGTGAVCGTNNNNTCNSSSALAWDETCYNSSLVPNPITAWYTFVTFHIPFGFFAGFNGTVGINPTINAWSTRPRYGISNVTTPQSPFWEWSYNATNTNNPLSAYTNGCYPMNAGTFTLSDKIGFMAGLGNTIGGAASTNGYTVYAINEFYFKFGGYNYRSMINSGTVTDVLTGNFWDTIVPTAVTNSVGAILNLNGFVISEISSSHSSLNSSFIYSNTTAFQLQQSSSQFCANGNNYLIAPIGNYSYQWFNNGNVISNTNNDSLFVSNNGSYFVNITGSCNVQSAVTVVSLSQGIQPIITPNGPLSICSGSSITLTSSASNGNLWSTGQTTNSIIVNNSGTYSVTSTSPNGCSSTSVPVTVNVNSLPSTPLISAGGPTTFCQGGQVTLTSSSAAGNLWSNGQTSQSINVNSAGNYSVTTTNANGCISSSSSPVNVTVNALPTIPVISTSGSTTFCQGGSVTLMSSNANGNTWSNGSTSNSITVGSSGVFTVLTTGANGCASSSTPITVTVNNLPTTPSISAVGPTTFCQGGQVTLTSSSATGNIWSNGQTSQSINVNSAGNYSVTTTNANGCISSSSSPVSVTVNALPTTPVISTSGSTTFCQGGSVTLTSSNANGNTWSNGSTSNFITVGTSGSFTVTSTGANGCTSSSAPITVTVNSLPSTPSISAGGPTTFCQGGQVTLTSSSPTGNLWSNGQTSQSINVNSAGNYSVTTTNANGCISSSSSPVSVTVNALPTTPVISTSGSTIFCQGGSVTLTSSNANGNTWSNGLTSNSISVVSPGVFTVTTAGANGCTSSSAPITVAVNSLPSTPSISAGGPTTFCQGGQVTLTSSSATGNLWSNGQTSQSITVNSTGNYSVTTTNANGCVSSSSSPVSVIENAVPTIPVISTSGSTTFCQGGSVTLTSSNAVGNTWSNGLTSNSITVGSSGLYTVTTTGTNGCTSSSAPITVTVNSLPSTPTIITGGSTTFCQGGQVTLTSSSATGNLWSNGQTSQSIIVNSTGAYSVSSTNSNNCVSQSSIPIVVTVNSVPSIPVITAIGNTTFCNGDSVLLASSSNTGNLWSNQETATSIYVFQSGVYSLQVINSNGCSSQSDPIVITVLPNPNASIVASGSTVICEGDNVTLTSSPASFYFWSNGNTNQSIIVSSSGLYSVMVTGNNGCSSNTQPVSVTVNDPSFSTLNESALDAYSLNGTTYTQSGTYTQVLTNAAGCDSTITLNLTLSFTGLGDNLQGIRIFPNPANDVLQIESTSALNGVFRIYDATGRMVLKGDFTGTNTNIDVRNLAPGTYTFQATNWTERIVVIRR